MLTISDARRRSTRTLLALSTIGLLGAAAAAPAAAQTTGHPGHSGHHPPTNPPAKASADTSRGRTAPPAAAGAAAHHGHEHATEARPAVARQASPAAKDGGATRAPGAKAPNATAPGASAPRAKAPSKPRPQANAPAEPTAPTRRDTTPAHPMPHQSPPVPAPAPALPALTIVAPSPVAPSSPDSVGSSAVQARPAHGHEGGAHEPAATATAVAGEPRRADTPASEPHEMWMQPLGDGWHVMGMAQVFPTVTTASLWRKDRLLNPSGIYATQPAAMINVASPNARLVLRTTLNFEAWTQREGELTLGGWGEGFIDSRHPHTLVHEAMLTANWWDVGGGVLSISAGKGFAPYGTDDPMGRPAVKFPTNHHLSQILERWTVNGAYLRNGWSVEAGLFGGAEPSGPYDFRNIESFGDSWSARVAKRLGGGPEAFGPNAPWELSASYAHVEEEHHATNEVTELFNAAVRHAGAYRFGSLYALVEASKSEPEAGEGHYSILGETMLGVGGAARHQPYLRVEYATRPEYERKGAAGTPGFFRYDHGAHEIGATRWLIGTLGYGYEASVFPLSVRPYVELQHNSVRTERGAVDPRALFGGREFWTLSAGARVFFGGGPMRMGSYGALDPMTAAMRPAAPAASAGAHGHH